MSSGRGTVSIVIAVLNDAATVEELVERIRRTLEGSDRPFEIVFVDDGSKDDTVAILRRLESCDRRVRVFELTRNFGQVRALVCGMSHAHGDVLVAMDGDLQNPPEEIPTLLSAIDDGASIATARRGARHEALPRWLASRAVHRIAVLLTGVKIDDFGGNFKAYRREVVDETMRHWTPGKPFFALSAWLGFDIAEVTVRHEARRAGRSRYRLSQLLGICVDLMTTFTTVPFALLAFTGLVVMAAGGLTLWFSGGPTPDWYRTAVCLAVMIIGSVFLAAAVLGFYLGRVYLQVSGGGPAFIVKRGPAHPAD